MTAGTPAPQDAETVVVTHPGQCCTNHCVVLVGERDEVGIHNVSHFMAGQISDLVSQVRAREVEAARRDGAREALEAAAQAAVTEDQGIPWDHDYDRATVAAWLSERADEVIPSDTIDHERTSGQGD